MRIDVPAAEFAEVICRWIEARSMARAMLRAYLRACMSDMRVSDVRVSDVRMSDVLTTNGFCGNVTQRTRKDQHRYC